MILYIVLVVGLLLFGGFVYFTFDFLNTIIGYLDLICWLLDGSPKEQDH